MNARSIKFAWILVIASSTAMGAENSHHNHGAHSQGMSPASSASHRPLPLEGGQSAFAALIEIVALLEKDPNTDWSQVDIDALRLHLRDMDRLMLNSEAKKTRIDSKTIRFEISGDAETVVTIRRMVTAHARYVQQSRGWEYDLEHSEIGATLTIKAEDEGVADRLFALGFYGFMSLDSHHQQHHYAMAKGKGH